MRHLFIASVVALAGCGTNPESNVSTVMHSFVASNGMLVEGATNSIVASDIETLLAQIQLRANSEDLNKLSNLDGYHLVVVPQDHANCGDSDDESIGCTIAADSLMQVATRHCGSDYPTLGIIAHEIGHAIGYIGHDYAPWFGHDGHGHDGMEKSIDTWACPDN